MRTQKPNKSRHLVKMVIGIGMVAFSYWYIKYSQNTLSFSTVHQEINKLARLSPPSEIIIGSIEINLKLEKGQIVNNVWQTTVDSGSYLDSSGYPGEGENIVIYGHNKKTIFGNLPYLSLDQKIVLVTQDGKKYSYQVYKKDFVRPDRVDLVSPTGFEELTVYTCWGLLDSQRVVIKAKPV